MKSLRDETHLRHYQLEGVDHIIDNKSYAIWTKMGGGKTITTLTALVELFESISAFRVLIIAPKKVVETKVWSNEAVKWSHTMRLRFHDLSLPSKPKKGDKEEIEQYKIRLKTYKKECDVFKDRVKNRATDIFVVNIDRVYQLVSIYKRDWIFDVIVIDESSLFGSPGDLSNRWKALKAIDGYYNRMIQLTGTPMGSGMMKIWSQIYLLDGGKRLGRTITEYRNRYFDHNKYTHVYKLREGAREEILRKISDIVMVVDEYDGLPPIQETLYTVKLSMKAYEKYEELERDSVIKIDDDEITAESAGVVWSKLLQVSNGAIYDANKNTRVIHNEKIQALKELVEQLNEQVIIVYRYQHDRDRILKVIPRSAAVDKTNSAFKKWVNGDIDALVMHPKSGGHGVEGLQYAGSTLIWFGVFKDADAYEQMNARLRRSGQTKTVFSIRMVCEGTLEHGVLSGLKDNIDFQDKCMSEIKKIRSKYVR